jgi:hypothetical protein
LKCAVLILVRLARRWQNPLPADCRKEFKDCNLRNGSSTAARSMCTKTLSLCQLHARQAAHQVAKTQHDVVAVPKAAVTNAAKTKTVGPGVKQSSK